MAIQGIGRRGRRAENGTVENVAKLWKAFGAAQRGVVKLLIGKEFARRFKGGSSAWEKGCRWKTYVIFLLNGWLCGAVLSLFGQQIGRVGAELNPGRRFFGSQGG